MGQLIMTENGTLDCDDLNKTAKEVLELLSKKGYTHHAAKLVIERVGSKLYDYCYIKV